MKLINWECLEEMDKEQLYENIMKLITIVEQKQKTIDDYEELNSQLFRENLALKKS